MNTLSWCEECKEQRDEWSRRVKVISAGWWLYEIGSWERWPTSKKHPWQMPSRYAHLFPDTPSYDKIDYLHDYRNRDPEVARAFVWVAIFIAQRKKEERLNREMAAAFDIPFGVINGFTPGPHALAQKWRDEWMQQMQFTVDYMVANMPINGPGNGIRVVSDIAVDPPIINGTPTEGES